MKPELDEKKRKTGSGIPPSAILVIAAILIFGTMFVFLFFENLNPDWLRTTS